jgi:hypothetical protein
MGELYSDTKITPEMVSDGVTPELIERIANELSNWESSGELYDEFARRLAVLFWKSLQK